ncbi:MAG: hypothetical protein HFG55_12045 [Lachnospiraceae bacterium]|nr:hypothetical protein [Lachnospiraceae bacterium]
MLQISVSEWLFWGGIGVMAAAAILAVIFLVIFVITGRWLKEKLEQEYGKPFDSRGNRG